mgnify:CR=1 FL=1
MHGVTIAVLKVVIALSLAGSLFVQLVMLPLVWNDLADAGTPAPGRIVFIVIFAAGILTLQVFAVCVWRLLTLVRRGAVFSVRSFRYIDIIIGAITAASVLTFALAVALAPGGVAPGLVALICGGAFTIAGVALLVVVMRRLLAQAIERDAEAEQQLALRRDDGGRADVARLDEARALHDGELDGKVERMEAAVERLLAEAAAIGLT